MNHRLNVLGFLNLAECGEKYATSANVGMLDLVMALEWVRDNVGRFGGDPGRVMIHGQSGGGGKTTTLPAMPAAKGVIHRAAVQSGSDPRGMPMDASLKLTAAILAELDLSKSQVGELHMMAAQPLLQFGTVALDPSPGRRMVRLQTALGEQLFDITERE